MRNISLLVALVAVGCGDIVSADIDAGGQDGGGVDAAPIDPCRGQSIAYEDIGTCMERGFCELLGCVGVAFPFCFDEDPEHPQFPQIDQYVRAGTVVYDPVAAATCVGYMLDSCNNGQFEIDFVPCGQVFVGTLVDGQACFSSDECGSSGHCNQAVPCSDQCCVGVCEDSNVPLYAPCDGSCDEGLYCVENPATMISTCQSGLQGAPCSSSSECHRELYCTENNTGELGECLPDVGENDACEGDHWCQAPLFCVGDDLPLGQGTCRRVDSDGDECDTDDNEPDLFGGCVGQFYCDQPVATAAGQCKPLPGDGESCTQSQRCASSDLYCGGGMCKPRAGDGMSCTNAVCQVGLVCRPNDLCGVPLANGSDCEDEVQCESFICAGTPSKCQSLEVCY